MSTVQLFDSVGEFLDEMAKPGYLQVSSGRPQPRSDPWRGSRSLEHASKITRDGIPGTDAEVAALIDRVNVDLPTYQRVWEPSVCGPVPIVPAAIAGLPDNMLMVTEQETTGVPLRIFVSVCLSAGCGADVIRKRGIALNALLQVVSARRAVELCIFGDMGCRRSGLVSPVIRVQAMPLDTSTLTAALTHAAFMRRLCFAWAERKTGWGGQWAHGMQPTERRARVLTREALGATDEDLVIFGAFLTESDKIIRDPVVWVQEQVALTEKNMRKDD